MDPYAKFAPGYDAGHQKPRCRAEDAALARVLARNVKPGANVLDAGCGTGLGWRLLQRKKIPVSYIGLDASTAMLKEAVKQLKSLDAALFLEQDMAAPWPISHSYLDAVLCLFALNYLDAEGRKIFSNRVRWHLKPGGRFVLVVLTEARFKMSSYCPLDGVKPLSSAAICEDYYWARQLRCTGLSRVLMGLNGHLPAWAYQLARPLDALAGCLNPDAAPYLIVEGRNP